MENQNIIFLVLEGLKKEDHNIHKDWLKGRKVSQEKTHI